MSRAGILFWICMLFAPCMNGQDFANYKPLRSEGQMPKKFITSSTEKFKKDVEVKISAKDKRHERAAKQKFLLENNFLVDQLLLSGKVLFNDPVSLYVNKVLDEVLKDDPKLRGEIEAYAVKSPAVNAFATDNGIILVNIGLIAHLENEAQLAFVLAHEVIHYKKQHSLDEYVETSKIESGRGNYKGTSIDERLLAQSNYSKEKESEADLEGLKIFMKTNYSFEVIDGVFDALQYAHLPYENRDFDKSFLERGSLIISPIYWLPVTDSISVEEENDSLSSHPAVGKRRQAVYSIIDDKSNKGRKDFIVGKADFFHVRKLCRFESTVQFIQNRQFESALYNSYLLLNETPANPFLTKSVFESLYCLAKFGNATELNTVHTDPDEISGESQRVNYLIDEISRAELSLMALVHGWLLSKKYPDDRKLHAQMMDIFQETVSKHYMERSFFSTAPRGDTLETKVGIEGEPKDDEVKTSKKKKKQKKKESDMARYALVELLQDPEFVKQFDAFVVSNSRIITKKKNRKKDNEEDSRNIFSDDFPDEEKKSPVSRMIIVNPYYFYVQETRKKAVKYIRSELGQRSFSQLVKSTVEKVGISYTMLDSKDLTASSTMTFNDISVLNEYFNRVTGDNEVKRVYHLEEELQSIKTKYNTRYVCWTGVLAAREKDEDLYSHYMAFCSCPFYLPVFAYRVLSPDYRTYFYTLVMDLETGRTVYNRGESFGIKDYDDVMKGTLYYTFAKIKASSKKKK